MRAWAAAVAAALTVLVAASPAAAQTATTQPQVTRTVTKTVTTTAPDPNTPVGVSDLQAHLPGYRLTGEQVQAIANKVGGKILHARRKYKDSYPGVYTKGPGRWQVSWFSRDKPPKEIAQLYIDDATGHVTEAWTGFYIPWTMARGYPGAFGRKVNSPWVWLPLTAIFLLGFFDRRRPLRIFYLDLAVLAAYGISVAFFNDARVEVGVPVLFPMLLYTLARMLWIGLRTRPSAGGAHEPIRMLLPTSWMAVGVIFLAGFRIGLDVTDSNVIDVGYAGVVGADRITHGEPLYGHFPKGIEHGDTYGPVTYLSYVPFVKILGWSGRWDDLPSAHGAAIAFDLVCLLLCFLLGRRVRGPDLGVALAFAWAAFPFTLYSLMCNANDALVSVFVLAALWAAAGRRDKLRGAFAALGGLAKFGSLGLAPVFVTYAPEEDERPFVRRVWPALVGFAIAAAVILVPMMLNGDSLRAMYDRSIGYQAGRSAPFSFWGLYDLKTPQHLWQVFAVVLAVGVGFLPRRRDVIGLAALAGGVLVALELSVTYWFYLYIVWFFPAVALAFIGRAFDGRAQGAAPPPAQPA